MKIYHCRHKNAKVDVPFEKMVSTIKYWRNTKRHWHTQDWKNLTSLSESLKNSPLSYDDGHLTSELIDIGEEDPIVALFSPELFAEIKRIIGDEPVDLQGDATFKTVPKKLFAGQGKGKQLFNLMITYNNRVNIFNISYYFYTI